METVASGAEAIVLDEKVELDNTYGGERESGYSTQQSVDKSSSDWELHTGEITDASSFDPPIWCSTNIKNEALECDFSSITNTNAIQGNESIESNILD